MVSLEETLVRRRQTTSPISTAEYMACLRIVRHRRTLVPLLATLRNLSGKSAIWLTETYFRSIGYLVTLCLEVCDLRLFPLLASVRPLSIAPRQRAVPAAAIAVLALSLSGCTDPDWANKTALLVGAPRADAAAIRDRQTAVFHDVTERQLLIETTQVLQDLGFTIEESVATYGVLAGSKDRDAVETGEVAGQIALAVAFALLGASYNATWDQDQVIRATVTSRPVSDSDMQLRVSFERIVTRNNGLSRAEDLTAPEFSTGFFDRVRAGLATGEQ
ncbi:hypothetical protein FDP22_06795 [Paroceanicella profunda]|uniref:Uncharacterized protein n=1 Tax=Paroceanicella profunda TaxID=2579971 RepID=A0A5B8FT15_9RHOB|nr:hypothetical protein [Paroceanicella profunda]QDL91515.1 hypothetical protein FDP22_06795 [Paroceanicella profunda]